MKQLVFRLLCCIAIGIAMYTANIEMTSWQFWVICLSVALISAFGGDNYE